MSNQFTLGESADSIRLRGAWEHVMRRLEGEVQPKVMERFLAPLEPIDFIDGKVVLHAPGAFVFEWVRDRYLGKLESVLSDELGEPIKIDLKSSTRERAAYPAAVVAPLSQTPDASRFSPMPRFRFSSFVTGQSNRLALAGAKAVAAEPGRKYNPLFIYGASGLGKTHLLHAIAHEVLGRDAMFPLTYISAQQFAEDFVLALQTNRIEQFRRAQRNVAMWLVDDIQFVVGKDKTQEEIFHTFNYLHSIGKQIVLCSDRPPRELFLMDERLRSRFESGLVADIQMPDTETRCAIVLSKAQQDQIDLPLDVAMLLAERVPGNIRVLEGALTKLAAQASIELSSISTEMAESIIERYYQSAGLSKPSLNQILDAVGSHYKIPIDDIRGISRKAPIAHARHVAVYITREITGDSWKHIGALFGDRDHTSMMHAYQKISELMTHDKDLHAVIKRLLRDLYPSS